MRIGRPPWPSHRHQRREGRQTPLWDSHERRYERERARRKPVDFGDRYTASVLRTAIGRAVTRANRDRREANEQPLQKWTPYQLRHAAMTRVRSAKGLEAAKAVGGHATVLMSEGYTVQAERELARRIVAEMG